MNDLLESLEGMFPGAKALVPKLTLALAILLIGLLLSLILRTVVRWAGVRIGIDRLAQKTGLQDVLSAIGLRRGLSHGLGTVLFYTGVVLTFAAVAEVFELRGVSTVAGALLAFLPRLLSGALMLLAGFWVAAFVRGLIRPTGGGGLDAPELVAKAAYYGIVIVTAMLAADQAGLEMDLADTVVTLIIAAAVFACGLGIGLGSRPMFESIIAKNQFAKEIQPGDHIKVGETEGVVVRYTSVALVLDTVSGEKLVPCKALLEGAVTLEKIDPGHG